jgi:hypothetical protein
VSFFFAPYTFLLGDYQPGTKEPTRGRGRAVPIRWSSRWLPDARELLRHSSRRDACQVPGHRIGGSFVAGSQSSCAEIARSLDAGCDALNLPTD